MLFLWGIATLFVAFISRDIIKKYFLPTNKPPLAAGALPVFGHLYTLDFSNLHDELQRIIKDTGTVFRIAVGSQDRVIVNGYEMIKAIFGGKDADFSVMPKSPVIQKIRGPRDLGLMNSSEKSWNQERAAVAAGLKKLMDDRAASTEKIISNQASKLAEFITTKVTESQSGRPVMSSGSVVRPAIDAAFSRLMFGQELSLESSKIHKLSQDLKVVSAGLVGSSTSAVNYWPWVSRLPFDAFGYKAFAKASQKVQDLLTPWLKPAGGQCQSEEEEESFAAWCLGETHRDSQDHRQLLRTIIDLWSLGSEKVTETLNNLILFMVRYPDIQEKVHLEVQERVGFDREPELSDGPRLNYLRACIKEAQRIGSVVDLTYSHGTKKGLMIEEFAVPKNTVVCANLYSVHMDGERYLQPEKYIPERFVDRDARELKEDPHIMPYGLGPRKCVGEQLAEAMVFIIFSSLVQKFKFIALPGRDFPDLKFMRDSTLHAAPFRFAIEKRGTDDSAERVHLE